MYRIVREFPEICSRVVNCEFVGVAPSAVDVRRFTTRAGPMLGLLFYCLFGEWCCLRDLNTESLKHVVYCSGICNKIHSYING